MKKIIGIISGALGIILTLFGIVMKVKGNIEVSIIGGADGPTSVFVAGKLGGMFGNDAIIIGILLLIIAGVILLRRKH